jgi:hypothetical protein
MFTKKFLFFLLSTLAIVLTACGSATPVPAAEAPQAEAPAAAQAQNLTTENLTYEVSGDTVEVFAGDKAIAKIVFKTKVDNMPTEWLKNRTGVAYLYQSGIGNKVQLEITLYEGGTFALDGDAVTVESQTLGVVNDPADVMVFADTAATYNVTGYSFGLAVGPVKDDQDKAGYVLSDRKAATNDNRPIFWLNPSGAPAQINK